MRIRNWETFQHYKHRSPPWIRLYRTLLDNPDWYALPGDAAKLLVELWLVASELSTSDGEIPDSTTLAWRTRRTVEGVDKCLKVLLDKGFLVMLAPCKHDASKMLLQSRVEESREENNGEPPDVEKYHQAAEELLSAPESEPTQMLTITGLADLANTRLGLGVLPPPDQQTNLRLVRTWNGGGRNMEEIMGAIEGLALMVEDERAEVRDWLPRGRPITLKALQNTNTLYDQGDGRAQRPLWDVAFEYYRGHGLNRPTPSKRGTGLAKVSA